MSIRLVGAAAITPWILSGCGQARPPYVVLFNSYFPSWIVCAAAGCIAAIIMRVMLVRWGVDEYLPFHFLTYLAFAAAVMFLLSLLIFSR
ncbi:MULTISPECIES: YtcA family lipoprotein [Achromobacter]|uniref:YtcA family lipoprotein n=1 Tax=Achromobacter TaxID=222 RepID=UPI00244B421C|nr:YtcA family lipoprotein [Achromobacter mucicolens]MDH0090293.1 YtcA family lipoprotein [Achromobacter mucicolens]